MIAGWHVYQSEARSFVRSFVRSVGMFVRSRLTRPALLVVPTYFRRVGSVSLPYPSVTSSR